MPKKISTDADVAPLRALFNFLPFVFGLMVVLITTLVSDKETNVDVITTPSPTITPTDYVFPLQVLDPLEYDDKTSRIYYEHNDGQTISFSAFHERNRTIQNPFLYIGNSGFEAAGSSDFAIFQYPFPINEIFILVQVDFVNENGPLKIELCDVEGTVLSPQPGVSTEMMFDYTQVQWSWGNIRYIMDPPLPTNTAFTIHFLSVLFINGNFHVNVRTQWKNFVV